MNGSPDRPYFIDDTLAARDPGIVDAGAFLERRRPEILEFRMSASVYDLLSSHPDARVRRRPYSADARLRQGDGFMLSCSFDDATAIRHSGQTTAATVMMSSKAADLAFTRGGDVDVMLHEAFGASAEAPLRLDGLHGIVRMFIVQGVGSFTLSDDVGAATVDRLGRLLDLLLPSVPADKLALRFDGRSTNLTQLEDAARMRGIRGFVVSEPAGSTVDAARSPAIEELAPSPDATETRKMDETSHAARRRDPHEETSA